MFKWVDRKECLMPLLPNFCHLVKKIPNFKILSNLVKTTRHDYQLWIKYFPHQKNQVMGVASHPPSLNGHLVTCFMLCYIVYEYPLASEACQFRLVLCNCTSTRCSCSALHKVIVYKSPGELFL